MLASRVRSPFLAFAAGLRSGGTDYHALDADLYPLPGSAAGLRSGGEEATAVQDALLALPGLRGRAP